MAEAVPETVAGEVPEAEEDTAVADGAAAAEAAGVVAASDTDEAKDSGSADSMFDDCNLIINYLPMDMREMELKVRILKGMLAWYLIHFR